MQIFYFDKQIIYIGFNLTKKLFNFNWFYLFYLWVWFHEQTLVPVKPLQVDTSVKRNNIINSMSIQMYIKHHSASTTFISCTTSHINAAE